jgi:hypothetical protein
MTTFIIGRDTIVHTPDLCIWAERGRIHMEDKRHNVYKSFSIEDAKARFKAIIELYEKKTGKRALYKAQLPALAKDLDLPNKLQKLIFLAREQAKELGIHDGSRLWTPEEERRLFDVEEVKPRAALIVPFEFSKDAS